MLLRLLRASYGPNVPEIKFAWRTTLFYTSKHCVCKLGTWAARIVFWWTFYNKIISLQFSVLLGYTRGIMAWISHHEALKFALLDRCLFNLLFDKWCAVAVFKGGTQRHPIFNPCISGLLWLAGWIYLIRRFFSSVDSTRITIKVVESGRGVLSHSVSCPWHPVVWRHLDLLTVMMHSGWNHELCGGGFLWVGCMGCCFQMPGSCDAMRGTVRTWTFFSAPSPSVLPFRPSSFCFPSS